MKINKRFVTNVDTHCTVILPGGCNARCSFCYDLDSQYDGVNYMNALRKAIETVPASEKIQIEMKNYKEEFRSKLPKIYSKELLESLFYEVYTKISYIEKTCGVTRITATSYLNQLEEIGLLESEKVGREKLYKNTRLIKLLSEN